MNINLQNILDLPDNDTIYQIDYLDNIVFCHEESKTNEVNNTLCHHIDETVLFSKSVRPEEINDSLRNIDLSEEKSRNANINADIYYTDNECFNIQNGLIQMTSAALNVDSKVNLNEDTKIEMKVNVSEASYLSNNFNFSNKTSSYVDEFDKFLKTKKSKAHKIEFRNTTDIPLPTHTETEDLFNNSNTKDDMEMLIDTTTIYEDSKIPLPILTLRNIDQIINDNESGECSTTHNDHNYAMVLSRDDSKELSINSENENNGQGKIVNTITEINALDSLKNTGHDGVHETSVVSGEQSVSENNPTYDMVKNSKRVNLHSSTTEEDQLLTKTDDLKVNKTGTMSMENENNVEDSDSEGYNSSDFEFIDEPEAYMEGIVIKSNEKANSFKFNRPEVVSNTYERYSTNYSRYFDRAHSNNRYILKNTFDLENESHCRSNHVIPRDETYLELFAQPWTAYHYEVEHKAFHSSKTMDVEVDNIGFNVGMLQRLHEENKVDHVFEQEAKENAKKILSMYPAQNRKRRRRF